MRHGFRWAALAGAVAMLVGMSAPTLAQGRGHGGGAFGAAGPSFSSQGYPPGFASPGRRMGWGGMATPPGWRNTHGRRRGWSTYGMPPGLYRRYNR